MVKNDLNRNFHIVATRVGGPVRDDATIIGCGNASITQIDGIVCESFALDFNPIHRYWAAC